jgi:hypothetical protein
MGKSKGVNKRFQKRHTRKNKPTRKNKVTKNYNRKQRGGNALYIYLASVGAAGIIGGIISYAMDSYELNEQRNKTAIENGKRSIVGNAKIDDMNQELLENVNAMHSVDKQSGESTPYDTEFERASENGRLSKPSGTEFVRASENGRQSKTSKFKPTKVKFTKKPKKTRKQLEANLNYFTQQGK